VTTEELERLLVEQPVELLHRLARGRVHRHFRAGKRRLIELLLRHSAENRQGFESDLLALIADRQSHPIGREQRRTVAHILPITNRNIMNLPLHWVPGSKGSACLHPSRSFPTLGRKKRWQSCNRAM
jgi:hypothetical protein